MLRVVHCDRTQKNENIDGSHQIMYHLQDFDVVKLDRDDKDTFCHSKKFQNLYNGHGNSHWCIIINISSITINF